MLAFREVLHLYVSAVITTYESWSPDVRLVYRNIVSLARSGFRFGDLCR